jgi:hypothetical protein
MSDRIQTPQQTSGGIQAPDADLSLPILPHLGAIAEARLALDLAGTTRRGVVMCGPKGAGKGAALSLALRWWDDREREREGNPAYQRHRVLRIGSLRGATYKETAVYIAKRIDKQYEARVRGAKKQDNDVRDDAVQMALNKRYVVILFDEGELLSAASLNLLRDLMAKAEDDDAERVSEDGVVARGLGIVLWGDESLETKVGLSDEANERWVRRIKIRLLEPDEVVEVYDAWFPGFAPEIAKMGRNMWVNYVTSLVCRGRTVSFRLIENHARAYVLFMQRSRGLAPVAATMPFDVDVFQQTFQEACWGVPASHGGAAHTSRSYSGRTAWGGRRGDG